MPDIRYLVVAFEEKDRSDRNNRRRSNMAKIRKTLWELAKNHNIKLMDFGTNFAVLTESERVVIERIFETVIERAKQQDNLRSIDNGEERNADKHL